MKIDTTEIVKVNAKTLSLHLKVTDRFSAALNCDDNTEIHVQHEGYVPDFMPGKHYGDYVILDIDIDSGQITNWKTPSAEQIQEWIKSENEE